MRGKTTFLILFVVVSTTAYLHLREDKAIGVNLHGVNHTDETFSFYLKDPDNPNTISGRSGSIAPFSASGISCCAMLPHRWESGLKLHIHTTHWSEKLPEGTLTEIKEIVEAEIPKYVVGKPGELWILRSPGGAVEVVSSDYQPDHPDWPGTLKGWPVPTIEYRRKRWELHRKIAAAEVDMFTLALEELESEPNVRARKDWGNRKEYRPQDLKGFSGPDDPLYIAERKASYAKVLETNKKDLQRILEAKP